MRFYSVSACFATSLVMAGCNSDHKAAYQGTRLSDSVQVIAQDKHNAFNCAVQVVDLHQIDSSSIRTLDSIKYDKIRNSFLSKRNSLPEYSEFDIYYLYKSFDCGDYKINTLIQQDESCCTYLYYLTLNKLTNKHIDVKLVSMIGSDGDWSENDYVQAAIYPNILRVTRIITEEVADAETAKYYKVDKDSVINIFEFLQNGIIKKTVVDSTRTSRKP